MEFSTTFTTTPRSVMQSYRACHRWGYVARWVMTFALVVLGVAAWNVVPAFIAAAYFALAELSVRRQLKPYLSGPRTVTVMISSEQYRTESSDRATARTWTTFTKVCRVGQFWVLRISNLAALSLPVSALDESQTTDFTDLTRAKGLLED